MRAKRVFQVNKLRMAALIVSLLIPVAGCDDNPVSPIDGSRPGIEDNRFTDVTEDRFTVDSAATVRVYDFVGRVTYRIGEAGTVRVVVTKRVAFRSDLDRIEVQMTAHPAGLDIRAENPVNLQRASVDLEITAPADAIPQVNLGVGEIDYRGSPRGTCRFRTGVGSIRLGLRADVNITVNLSAGVGSISLGIPVDGVISYHPSVVRGRIGHGGEGYLHANAGVGSIYLSRL
jgi:hypothetical protein